MRGGSSLKIDSTKVEDPPCCDLPSLRTIELPAAMDCDILHDTNGMLWEVDMDLSQFYSNVNFIAMHKYLYPGRPFPFRLYWLFSPFAMRTHSTPESFVYEWYHEEDLKIAETMLLNQPYVKVSEIAGRIELEASLKDGGRRISATCAVVSNPLHPEYTEEWYLADNGDTFVVTLTMKVPDGTQFEQMSPVGMSEDCHRDMDLAVGSPAPHHSLIHKDRGGSMPSLMKKRPRSRSSLRRAEASNAPIYHKCNTYQLVMFWKKVTSSKHFNGESAEEQVRTRASLTSSASLVSPRMPSHLFTGLQHAKERTSSYSATGVVHVSAYATSPSPRLERKDGSGYATTEDSAVMLEDVREEKSVDDEFGELVGSYSDTTSAAEAAVPYRRVSVTGSTDPLPQVRQGRDPDTEESVLSTIKDMDEAKAKEILSRLMMGEAAGENRQKLVDFCASSEPGKSYDLHGGRDWNTEYQALMDERKGPTFEEKDWCAKMYRLEADFSHAAALYAQVIINELSLKTSQKTILPVKIGGEAGGIKYMVNGILFKFAKDSIVFGNTYMYGGASPRHDLAMKAARLELQGLSCFIAAGSPRLHLPLMTVINYLGHRMVATSILPINHSTLRYGSDDGGATVHMDIPELNLEMQYVGEFWNLAEHSVGRSQKLLSTPGDLEGHLGTDGRFYVCDFARLMPPEAPSKNHVEIGREVFYKLLRPELVIRYARQLSPDTFTGWGAFDSARAHHEAAVISCSQFLFEKVIPKVAKKLDNIYFMDNPLVSTMEKWLQLPTSKLADLLDRISVSTQMHFAGVNFRHIGLVRRHSKCDSIKLLLLCYAVARVVKNLIRLDMFTTMTKLSHPSDLEFRMLILHHFNSVLSPSLHALPDDVSSLDDLSDVAKEEAEYWVRVEDALHEQFEHCWEPTGIKGVSLFASVDRRIVLHYLLNFTGITISRSVTAQLKQCTNDNTFTRFVIADVKYPKPKSKQPFLYDIIAAKLLLPDEDDMTLASPPELKGKLRQLQLAKEKCKRAWKQVPISPQTSFTFAQIVLRGVELSLQCSSTPSWSLYYDINLASTGLEMCSKVFPTTQTMSLWRKLLLLSGRLCTVYSLHNDSKFQEENLSEVLLRLQEKIVFLEAMSEKLPGFSIQDNALF